MGNSTDFVGEELGRHRPWNGEQANHGCAHVQQQTEHRHPILIGCAWKTWEIDELLAKTRISRINSMELTFFDPLGECARDKHANGHANARAHDQRPSLEALQDPRIRQGHEEARDADENGYVERVHFGANILQINSISDIFSIFAVKGAICSTNLARNVFLGKHCFCREVCTCMNVTA